MDINIVLSFSDAAKFADIARNLVGGLGYVSSFITWDDIVFGFVKQGLFFVSLFPPVVPFSIAVFYKIFGVGDFAVIATSLFYFLLTLIFVFLLAKQLFKSSLVGFLSTLAVGFNYDLINYATSGASESPFIFEIVAASYFITLKKKWGTLIALLFLILMYFTRPQAIIYISGLLIYFLFLNLHWKKAVWCSIGMLVLGALSYFFFSEQAVVAVTRILPGVAVSDALRGGTQPFSFSILLKKLFYDLYNFYKLLPQIINPYLFMLFVISLFSKDNKEFKIASVFMVLATFLVTALTIPFFRYLHPIIPLVYITAVGTLVGIFNSQFINFNEFSIFNLKITKSRFIVLTTTFLILVFGVGQTLGIIFLDSRFEKNTHNVGKPPVYAQLSYLLRDNTNKDQVVITNLDTWGSWYGERKTVWFPLEPKQLIDPATGKIPFDAIYLTNYLIDDENYYMGMNWRLIFENPKDSKKWICDGCGEIAKEFKLKEVFLINSTENYERQDAKAVLLVKK